jgi:signal transduction histidine kinase
VAKASFFVRLSEYTRATTFRWTLLVSGTFAVCILLMFGFVYWQTAQYTLARVDEAINAEADIIRNYRPELRLEAIGERLRQDPRRVKLAGLFGPDGAPVAGNVETLPNNLQPDSGTYSVSVIRVDAGGREEQRARATARQLPDGQILMVGRNVDELAETAEIVGSALALGLLPALCLAVAAGIFLSRRAQKRIEEVNKKVQRIIAGELRERLPTQGTNDPFEKLSLIVNGMLDEMEMLIQSVAGVGDDIAHDLRTPLTRVRVGLERARDNAQTLDDLRAAVDQAIGGLDQSLTIITALLRIAEIEQTRRLDGFGAVGLPDLVREVGDLYEPIAEDKGVAFGIATPTELTVRGDRDLLFEAIANLVDNAIKFTPVGGRVELAVIPVGGEAVIRVRDTGPGINANEREIVTRRFYRSDKSRHTHGLGLGLSLVAAIVKLHGFRLKISPGPGCVVEIICPASARLSVRPAASPAFQSNFIL